MTCKRGDKGKVLLISANELYHRYQQKLETIGFNVFQTDRGDIALKKLGKCECIRVVVVGSQVGGGLVGEEIGPETKAKPAELAQLIVVKYPEMPVIVMDDAMAVNDALWREHAGDTWPLYPQYVPDRLEAVQEELGKLFAE